MDTDFKSVISKWVKSAREKAGLSGDQLGARLALEMGSERGNSKSNISHWENMRHEPNIQQIVAISKITRQKLPDEISELLNLNGKQLESNKQVYALTWMREDELELLTRYRLASEAGKALILNMAEEAPREESKVRSIPL